MNLFEEFLTQIGMFVHHVDDIPNTSDDSEFTVVDGEEGDYGLIKYSDAGGLLAIRKVEGGDSEETYFTKYAVTKLTPLAKKWINEKIATTFNERNILQIDTKPKFYECEGSTLSGRIMTEEEQTRELTGKRFMDWMSVVGEEYVDQCGIPRQHFREFCDFLIDQRKANDFISWSSSQYEKEVQRIKEKLYGEPLSILGEIYEGAEINNFDAETDFPDTEKFYCDYAEFLNTIPELKAQTNANLIIRMDYYSSWKTK